MDEATVSIEADYVLGTRAIMIMRENCRVLVIYWTKDNVKE